jgi:hypothetical protein
MTKALLPVGAPRGNGLLARGRSRAASVGAHALAEWQPAPAEEHYRKRLRRAAGVLACAVAASPIAVYLWVALHRIGYRFELDWMEGGSVELAARVGAGHSLYTAPSLGFVGWAYTPLYYWLAAAVAKVTGVGFVPLRLISLLASLVSMATLAWIVTRQTASRIAGLMAAGLFAATFVISGAWFDVGRVDSLFLALTLIALAWGDRTRTTRGGITLGLLGFLAFFTKQTALIALLPPLAYLAAVRPRVGIPAVGTIGALMAGSTWALNGASNGWYGFYVFSELAHQGWTQQAWAGFWLHDVGQRQWPLLILIAGGAVAVGQHRTIGSAARSGAAYYSAATAGLLAAAWASRLHTGGYENVLMPAYAAIALLAGQGYARLTYNRKPATRLMAAALVVAQLVVVAYPISAQLPTTADNAAGRQLLARLHALPGPVLVLRHPWYATIAGKGTFAQEEAIGDVLRSTAPRGARILRASLANALDAYHIQAVVLDGSFDTHFFASELAREFRPQQEPITRTQLYPLTDVRTAPTLVYIRINQQDHDTARGGVRQ